LINKICYKIKNLNIKENNLVKYAILYVFKKENSRNGTFNNFTFE